MVLLDVIASCGNVRFYRHPQINYFSLFNSPYYAHTYGGAIDFYVFDEEQVFPCLTPGRVVAVRRVRATAIKKFPHSDVDYMILVRSENDTDFIIRVMHVKPFVEEGEFLDVGEPLGELLRSGFFDPWTSLHAHVEVKRPDYAFRARGSLPVELSLDGRVEGCVSEELSFKVVYIDDFFVMTELEKECMRVGKIRGIGVKVGKYAGILDCGLPHYRQGGVILPHGSKVQVGDPVVFGGLVVGRVMGFNQVGVAISLGKVSLECEGVRLKGVSAFLSLNDKCMVKLITLKGEETSFMKGERICLKLDEGGLL